MRDSALRVPPELHVAGGRSAMLSWVTIASATGARIDLDAAPSPVLAVQRGKPRQVRMELSEGRFEGVLRDGMLGFVPRGSRVMCESDSPGVAVLISFSEALVQRMEDAFGTFTANTTPHVAFRDPILDQLAHTLEQGHADPALHSELFLEGLGLQLAAQLRATLSARRSMPRRRTTAALDARRLQRVLEYVEAHLDASLTLAELSEQAGVSPFHFARAFTSAVGVPPHRYVIDRRLETARERLARTTGTVTEVAVALGFATPSHLARLFKRKYGHAPSKTPREVSHVGPW